MRFILFKNVTILTFRGITNDLLPAIIRGGGGGGGVVCVFVVFCCKQLLLLLLFLLDCFMCVFFSFMV